MGSDRATGVRPRPDRGISYAVGAAEADLRLDRFLAAAGRLGSRGRATDAIAKGKVFVNDAEAAPGASGRPLAAGDVVRVWMDRPGSARRRSHRPAGDGDVQIVFEDDALIVVNKPAGLLTVPLERQEDAPTVVDALLTHLRSRGKRRPFIVHRIDRDTSGLVLFALRTDVQQALKAQFKRREPERVYLAVVYGHPSPAAGTWRDTLVWDHRALIQKETHPRDPDGKDAVAKYRVLETFRDASLVEVTLVTGKRNQIRLQARLRGHTLVGEERYVYGPDLLRPIRFARQALHAQRLGFVHPVTGRRVSFEATVPEDLSDLLSRLRKSPGGPSHVGKERATGRGIL